MRSFICVVALGVLAPMLSMAQSMPTTGGEPVWLAGSQDNVLMQPRWSPNGDQIAVAGPRYQGISLLSSDGTFVTQLSDLPGVGFRFQWAPDQHLLVGRASRFDGPRRLDAIVVLDAASRATSTLLDFSTDQVGMPEWAADRISVRVDVSAHPQIIDPAGRTSKDASNVLDAIDNIRFELEGRTINHAVSPDRAKVAYEVVGGSLMVRTVLGEELDLGDGHRPSWAPDSEWLVFERSVDDGHEFLASDLYAVSVQTGRIVQLTNTSDKLEMNADWSPDGLNIAYDSDGGIFVLPIEWRAQ